MLFATFLSPLLMVIVAALVVVMARDHSMPKPKVGVLIWLSVFLAAAGALLSLALLIGWMAWYEKTTGYSAGNAPLAWMFVYGPASAALGQLLALLIWWFKKPTNPPDAA